MTTASAATPHWSIREPKVPDGHPSPVLNAVSCSAAPLCTAVGGYDGGFRNVGPITVVSNGGRWSWQAAPRPWRGGRLFGVSCASSSQCMAVGYLDNEANQVRALAEEWDGSTWAVLPFHLPSGLSQPILDDVSCSSATACVAVGTAQDSEFATVPLAETWDGMKWTPTEPRVLRNRLNSGFSAVSCASATACVAVGGQWNDLSDEEPLVETLNGAKWKSSGRFRKPSNTQTQLSAVSCTDALSACAVVGFYYDRRSKPISFAEHSDDATNWSPDIMSHPPGAQLDAVSCATADWCIATGSSAGKPYALRWVGVEWIREALPDPEGTGASDLWGVSCTSTSSCTAVGTVGNDVDQSLLVERYS